MAPPLGSQMLIATAALLLSLQPLLAQITPAIDPTSYLAKVTSPIYNVSEYWAAFKPAANHDTIVAASPDIWKTLPAAFDPMYKNPCWTDSYNRFRCIPYFQILGVSKCGTTDLFARLKRHPELADGSKGPHWWDECPYPPRGPCTAPPHGDFDGYADLFEKGAYQMKANPRMVTGEASSNTFTGVFTFVRGPAVRRSINITLAELIREAQPYQRLIVLFRDPVTRFYSAFHYYGRRKADGFQGPEKFHTRVTQEIERWKDCEARRGKEACLKRYDPQQLIKGMYGEFVEAWTKVFPREQIMFIRNEDYQAKPQEHLKAVIKFLGLKEPNDSEWMKVLGVARTNAQSSRYPRMLEETRTLLTEFYAPFNQKLASLLGDDRFLWLDSPTNTRRSSQAA